MTRANAEFTAAFDYARQKIESLALDGLAEAGVFRRPEDYYLVGTYPPLKAMRPVDESFSLHGITSDVNAYFHIPFCRQRCTFCHFAKEILPQTERVERYLSALEREIATVPERVDRPLTAVTAYFGGGTPSYLTARQVSSLFQRIRSVMSIPESSEITYELHPGVVDESDHEERLDAMEDNGVNRWVFGVQSMDDRILKKINRGHDASHVIRLLELLERRKVTNLSVDLMYGLPYQTYENWFTTLRQLVTAGVEKFNIFPLMFKNSDPISAHFRRDPANFPGARARLMMHFLMEGYLFSHGYKRGPIFYYAKSSTHSRQQENKYDSIEEVNLLPFGVSGFGYVNRMQFYNHCEMNDYISAIERDGHALWCGVQLSEEEQMRRSIMFGLRSGGIDIDLYKKQFQADPTEKFHRELAPYFEFGLLRTRHGRLELTDAGIPFADSVGLHMASEGIKELVRETNATLTSPRIDPLDRYDFFPLGRETHSISAVER